MGVYTGGNHHLDMCTADFETILYKTHSFFFWHSPVQNSSMRARKGKGHPLDSVSFATAVSCYFWEEKCSSCSWHEGGYGWNKIKNPKSVGFCKQFISKLYVPRLPTTDMLDAPWHLNQNRQHLQATRAPADVEPLKQNAPSCRYWLAWFQGQRKCSHASRKLHNYIHMCLGLAFFWQLLSFQWFYLSSSMVHVQRIWGSGSCQSGIRRNWPLSVQWVLTQSDVLSYGLWRTFPSNVYVSPLQRLDVVHCFSIHSYPRKIYFATFESLHDLRSHRNCFSQRLCFHKGFIENLCATKLLLRSP